MKATTLKSQPAYRFFTTRQASGNWACSAGSGATGGSAPSGASRSTRVPDTYDAPSASARSRNPLRAAAGAPAVRGGGRAGPEGRDRAACTT